MAKLVDVLGLALSGGIFKELGRGAKAGCLVRVDGHLAPVKKSFSSRSFEMCGPACRRRRTSQRVRS